MLASGWKKICLTLSAALLATGAFAAEPGKITVKADQSGVTISPTLYGIFYEEISRAGDGGLYAEMIQNRSFEDPKYEALSVKVTDKPLAWELVKVDGADGSMTLDNSKPLNANNKHCLKVTVTNPGKGAGVANVGFHNTNDPGRDKNLTKKYALLNGIPVQKDKQYNLSFYVRAEGDFKGPLTVGFKGKNGMLAEEKVKGFGADWKKFDVALKAKDTDPETKFIITSESVGTFYLDMVSVFPKDTFKNRPNGMRADLAQMVADMKPKFVRYPGGCYVAGHKLDYAVRWKKTIGDIAERPGLWNLWGYMSTNGFGAKEFFDFCEDIQAEPLYVINCGMSFWEQDHQEDGLKVNLDEYIQDALDIIEYANGPVDSKWGAVRAKEGHPKPYNMKYMEIGNEEGGKAYHRCFEKFRAAILEKHPQMRLIACVWSGTPKKELIDIMDEHYYASPKDFFKMESKYDKYDRKGPKVYVGEYAAGGGRGNWIAALSEAAFMTGMERNSDVVEMGSYAPLFSNPAWEAWNPNAIVFDSSRAYGTPSYYVQALFGNNKPDVTLAVDLTVSAVPQEPISGTFGVGNWNTQAEYKDIQVTGANGEALFQSGANMNGWKKGAGKWDAQDGVIKQTSNDSPALALIEGKNWSDCTLTLKARKTGGSEGFLIPFGVKNLEESCRWNIGGWGNKQSALEWDEETKKLPITIETDRWYDIKVELKGQNVKCSLDGIIIHDVTRTKTSKSFFAVAGRAKDTNEIIVKVVNASQQPQEIALEITGAKALAPTGKAIIMTSDNPKGENSFTEPTKIAPKEEKLEGVSDKMKRTFPPYSITVLRLQEKK